MSITRIRVTLSSKGAPYEKEPVTMELETTLEVPAAAGTWLVFKLPEDKSVTLKVSHVVIVVEETGKRFAVEALMEHRFIESEHFGQIVFLMKEAGWRIVPNTEN